MTETPISGIARTALGWVAVAATANGILAVTLPQADAHGAQALLHRQVGETTADLAGKLDSLLLRLVHYYEGEAVALDDELDMSAATPFQRQVWEATRRVPRGVTTTYGALAQAVGASPAAARAVGRCMALNPWPPLVPCHRVLGKDGSLTGFGGGIAVKKRMLEMEGALLTLDDQVS